MESQITAEIAWFFVISLQVVTSNLCTLHEISEYGNRQELITSDGFPGDYRSNTNQCFDVRNMDVEGVTIEIRDVKTELRYDKLLLLSRTDRDERNYDRIAEISGEVADTTYESSKHWLLLNFTSDSSVEYRGWQACVCPKNVYLVSSSCGCSWRDPELYLNSDTSWSSWSSADDDIGYGGFSVTTVIVPVVIIAVLVSIVVGVVKKRISRRRNPNQQVTILSHVGGTPMRPVTDATPIHPVPGSYPTQQGTTGFPPSVPPGTAQVTYTPYGPAGGQIQGPHYGPSAQNQVPHNPGLADPPPYSDAIQYPKG